MTDQAYIPHMSDLPDPVRQPEFYDGVTSKRLLAWVIDTGVILALTLLAVLFTAFVGLLIFPVLYLVLGFAYRTVCLANGSATLGMRVAAIELRRADGQRFDLPTAFWHTFGYTVSISMPLIQIVSIVLMMTTTYKQGLTDHAIGTTALNKRR